MKKIIREFDKLTSLRYESEHGGKYVYMQFLAQARMLLRVLRRHEELASTAAAVEGACWLLNEMLPQRFSHRHKAEFEATILNMRALSLSLPVYSRRSTLRMVGEPTLATAA